MLGTGLQTVVVPGQLETNGINNVGTIFSTTLVSTGDTAVGGNANVIGTLTVDGASTTNGITNTGAISTTTLATSSNATVGGNASVAGTLAVTGASTLTGALTANGGVSTTTLATSSNATVGGTLAVTGASTTNGITNTGAISTTTLTTSGNASVGGTLDMNGKQINNVADGTAPKDAVNYGQLIATRKILAGGIASSVAMSNIPLVDTNKSFAVGVALGGYDGQSAIAVGASYRVNPSTVFRGSIAGGSATKPAVGAGMSVSW